MTLQNTDIKSAKQEVFNRNINDTWLVICCNVGEYIRDRGLIDIAEEVRVVVYSRTAREVLRDGYNLI